jgi:hypothetical protein
MTATLDFLVTEKKDVVLVPSAAFRFTPSDEIAAAARRKAFEERLAGRSEAEKAEAMKQYDARVSGGEQRSGTILGGGGPRIMIAGPGGPPGGPGSQGGQGRQGTAAAETRKTLWLMESDGSVSMSVVRTGASDGTNTEIVDGEALVGKTAIVRGQ